jgi:hypothetical protein
MCTIYFSFICFAYLQNQLDLLAIKTRQINVPKSPAKMTRQKNLPWQLAGSMCDFNLLNLTRQN